MITILLIVVVVIGALVVLASQSGGPRVTTIEHRTEHKEDGDDA